MLGAVIDCVYSNSVDSQSLELFNISFQVIDVQQRILSAGRSTWLIRDAANIEPFAICPEGCSIGGYLRKWSDLIVDIISQSQLLAGGCRIAS